MRDQVKNIQWWSVYRCFAIATLGTSITLFLDSELIFYVIFIFSVLSYVTYKAWYSFFLQLKKLKVLALICIFKMRPFLYWFVRDVLWVICLLFMGPSTIFTGLCSRLWGTIYLLQPILVNTFLSWSFLSHVKVTYIAWYRFFF